MEVKNEGFLRSKIAENDLTHFPESAFFRKKLGGKIQKNGHFCPKNFTNIDTSADISKFAIFLPNTFVTYLTDISSLLQMPVILSHYS